MGNNTNFIGGSINIGEGIGSLIADCGETQSTNLKHVLDDTRLVETNVFDGDKVNNIGGFRKKRTNTVLNNTAVGDKDFVGVVNIGSNEPDHEENAVKGDHEGGEVAPSGVIKIEKGVHISAKREEDKDNSQDKKGGDFADPDANNANTGTFEG